MIILITKCSSVVFQTKQLCIEIYKWIKDALRAQLQNIKPVQVGTNDCCHKIQVTAIFQFFSK